MFKIRFVGLMIVSALIFAAVVVFPSFSSRASAVSPASELPVASSGDLPSTGLTRVNCYSAAFHAASDCDRLTYVQAFILPIGHQPIGQAASRLSSLNCFSTAYHAASDCDRLALTQIFTTAGGNASSGLTLLNCFSTAFHAATDCDRLAFANK